MSLDKLIDYPTLKVVSMTRSRPSEEEIFQVACELSPEFREVYLNQVCAADEALKDRLKTLLRADGQADVLQETKDASAPNEIVSKTIGPYKILQEIGKGGMGVVYMAEQTEPVRRVVALKIVKPGLDSDQVVARFEAERQALAMMDHPNIAKVLDAGTTEDDLPYFVMELVKGYPITQYCDEHRLNTNERLRLFTGVCRGLQHAHHKGIIHRDLKPSNVLVAEYDEQIVPKIIDFGVAKATHQKLTEKTLYTQFGTIVGTLDYMSPEQAKFNQLDIDTRSDVYSLGVMLFELLTGETPIEKNRLQSSGLEEVLRIIREDEPQRPSHRLSSSTTLPSTASKRKTDPKHLAGQLREDLDWIVIKAMAKDRDERYQSPDALAADIDRFMNDAPIEARRPSLGRRVKRFARRNRVTVTASACVLMAVATACTFGVVAYLKQQESDERTAELHNIKGDLSEQQNAQEQERWARAVAMPQIEELFAKGRAVEAIEVGKRARSVLTNDPGLEHLLERISRPFSLPERNDDVGTKVFYRDAFLRDSDWTFAGTIPLENVSIPDGHLRLKLSRDGFRDRETQTNFDTGIHWLFTELIAENTQFPEDLTLIRAGRFGKVDEMHIDEFFLERFEVTNDQFRRFVVAGGYENPEYWSDLDFAHQGESLSFEEAMQRFVDQSGKPGPAMWKDGQCPIGKQDHPVCGVSWFEAAAYAKFVGRSLPTVHHWKRAAHAPQSWIACQLNNFSGEGTASVRSQVGIGVFDVYGMAGNVKEWCWNEDGTGRRYALGGSWKESEYMFHDKDMLDPWARNDNVGFRCMVSHENRGKRAKLQASYHQSEATVDWTAHSPMSLDELRENFRYGDTPLNAVQVRDDYSPSHPAFRHETIQIDAAYNGERFDIHLLIPKHAKPPYDTIVCVPGVGVIQGDYRFEPPYRFFEWNYIRRFPTAGMTVCVPILQLSFDRWDGKRNGERQRENPAHAVVHWIQRTQDIFRTLDHLETRSDVARVIYFGHSLGAMHGPLALALDDRFDAAILSAGGLLGPMHDGHPVQFLPHISQPTLMINGFTDTTFNYQTSQVPMFEQLGSKTKRHVLLNSAHNADPRAIQDISIQWLDDLRNGRVSGVEPAEIPDEFLPR